MGNAVRIGLLRLADAAPAIAGVEWGMFARHGLDVALSVEPSWANVADKLSYGMLDAAVMLPPLAMAMATGLREPRTRLLVPMGLSRGGNAVVLSGTGFAAVRERLAGGDGPRARARAVADWAAALRRGGAPPRLGIVHLFSGHNLLLRHWLATGGADPDRDVELVVLPPAAMGAALAEGSIDGFCAGAPWSAAAERDAGARVIVRGSEIRPRGGEKVLAVREDWADAEPERLRQLLRGFGEAARCCDDPERAAALAALLGTPEYVGADPAAIRRFLPGGDPDGTGVDPLGFGDALLPDAADAAWFADALCRWHWLPPSGREDAAGVYRLELGRGVLEAVP